MSRNRQLFLYQIYYDEVTKALLDPGFIPLDNRTNLRPDWFEYWSIRKILLGASFGDDDYIGFFSPKFYEKTGITSAQVKKIVETTSYDVISFSPFLEENSLFPNSFQQGDLAHPGLFNIFEILLQHLDIRFNLRAFVGDTSNTIYSNYFVANFSFWKNWFDLFERIFDLCESNENSLGKALNNPTFHNGAVRPQMKIFILERLVTILLAHNNKSAALGIDYRSAPSILDPMHLHIEDLLICDSLKGQYVRTGAKAYLDAYWSRSLQTRDRIFNSPMAL